MIAKLKIVLLILLGMMLGINLYLLGELCLGENRLPMVFGLGAAVVQSGSMEPTFSKGDLLFIKEESDYAVGDVVVYPSGRMMVVHRITGIVGDSVTTQGDANNAADEPFDKSCIKGRVIGSIPRIGLVFDFLKTPIGLGLIISGAAVLTAMSFRKKVKEE